MTPALLLLAACASAPPPATDLKLPPGFTARLYADNPVAPDIYTMSIDDEGRVLIAGRGYVRVLVDDDNDGSADRAIDLIDGLKDGPMGLLAEGDSLFVVCDGGLKRYRGYNGKDKLKGPPELILALKTGGEHDAHAVRRGSDGWLYLLCGNIAGVRKEMVATPHSPVREPIAGALLRLSPDLKTVEIVADGFRNPYSFDFNLNGEPFTYDSDNERCVGLPWYETCRFYHVVPGGNYGWRSPQLSQTWRKPAYFADVIPPVAYLGRGSPTGVACYRHTHFPTKYRGGFFLADWTFGHVHYVPLRATESIYAGQPEVFAEATGTSGFAPTAIAVHPRTGELFVSIGGRGTRGGVYRISHNNSTLPKPLSMAKRTLDYDANTAKQLLTDCTANDARVRRTALELIWRHRDRKFDLKELTQAVRDNLAHRDPLVRAACGRVAVAFAISANVADSVQAKLTLAFAQLQAKPDFDSAIAVAQDTLEAPKATADEKLQAVRLIQLAFGDLTASNAVGNVWEGYTLRNPEKRAVPAKLKASLIAELKSENANLVREVARTLGALRVNTEEVIHTLALKLTADSTAMDDIHYLAVLGSLPPPKEWPLADTQHTARALLRLEAKSLRNGNAHDRHWPLRVAEITTSLASSAPQLGDVVLNSPDFGKPEHTLFLVPLKISRAKAAEKFVRVATADAKFEWTPAIVNLLAELPSATARPLVEKLWEQPQLRDSLIRVLLKHPATSDEKKLVLGLDSNNADTVRVCAVALATLPQSGTSELLAAIKALRRFEDKNTQAAIANLLRERTKEKHDTDAKAWVAWFTKQYPNEAKALSASDNFDSALWNKRLTAMDWTQGDATRGRSVFAKASCAACHDGGRAIGPSLLGITKRFSRDDLLTAILQPNKDVSPRYRPTRITTTYEKSFTGIVIYEATDGLILQTNADTTVRIAGEQIATKKTVDISLMPAGLLDKLSDREVADLMAYMATLAEPKPK